MRIFRRVVKINRADFMNASFNRYRNNNTSGISINSINHKLRDYSFPEEFANGTNNIFNHKDNYVKMKTPHIPGSEDNNTVFTNDGLILTWIDNIMYVIDLFETSTINTEELNSGYEINDIYDIYNDINQLNKQGRFYYDLKIIDGYIQYKPIVIFEDDPDDAGILDKKVHIMTSNYYNNPEYQTSKYGSIYKIPVDDFDDGFNKTFSVPLKRTNLIIGDFIDPDLENPIGNYIEIVSDDIKSNDILIRKMVVDSKLIGISFQIMRLGDFIDTNKMLKFKIKSDIETRSILIL